MALPFVDRSSSSLPVQIVGQPSWREWLKEQSAARRGWLESTGVAGKAGDLAVLPGRDGKAAGAVLVLSAKPTLWDFGALATRLPAGTWRLASRHRAGVADRRRRRHRPRHLALRALSQRTRPRPGAKIVWPQGADKARATAMIESICMARDLITTPSSDMGPAELAAAAAGARQDAQGARCKVIVGDDLLKQNYPDGACRRPRQHAARRG